MYSLLPTSARARLLTCGWLFSLLALMVTASRARASEKIRGLARRDHVLKSLAVRFRNFHKLSRTKQLTAIDQLREVQRAITQSPGQPAELVREVKLSRARYPDVGAIEGRIAAAHQQRPAGAGRLRRWMTTHGASCAAIPQR